MKVNFKAKNKNEKITKNMTHFIEEKIVINYQI